MRPSLKRAGLALVPAMALGVWGVVICIAWSARASSTAEGAFTAEQAERGKRVYETSCANCHPAEFYAERLRMWEDETVGALFEAVATTMPADDVGSLRDEQYLDVLAYVFQITGSPTGDAELTTESMGDVTIRAPGK